MAIPTGLHIGQDNAIVLTYNGSAVANTLSFEANFGTPAGRNVLSMLSADGLYVGVKADAQVWKHNGAAWSKVIDAYSTNIVDAVALEFLNSSLYCVATDSATGTGGTEIWRYNMLAGPAPTTALSSIPAPFIGAVLKQYDKDTLLLGGYNKDGGTNYVRLYKSTDQGASWTQIQLYNDYLLGAVRNIVCHSDGYVYVSAINTASPISMTTWRSTDLLTWTNLGTTTTYTSTPRAAISHGSKVFIPMYKAASGTNLLVYDGSSWALQQIDATTRTVRGFGYFTVASPGETAKLYLVADDDILLYDDTLGTWSVADTGATTSYNVIAGSMTIPETIYWTAPPSGSGITTSTKLYVEGRGLTFDTKVYKDSGSDTANWTAFYYRNNSTGALGVRLNRSTALTDDLANIDIYVTKTDATYAVRRFGYLTKATENTTSLRAGDSVKLLLDNKIYWVSKTRMLRDVRQLLLSGTGDYDAVWVNASYANRVPRGGAMAGTALALGTPPSTPPV